MFNCGTKYLKKNVISFFTFIVVFLLNFNVNILTTYAYTPAQSGCLTYGYDMFSEDYASGYIYITNGTSRGCIIQGNDYWPNNPYENRWFTTTSKTRNSNIYVDHYNGAYMNGESYDIREYIYVPDGEIMGIAYNNGEAACWNVNKAVREFHFYKSGTLNSSNPVEVSFKGIIQLVDLDMNEGYRINNINRTYLTNPTDVTYKGNKTWLGTIDNDGGPNWGRGVLWAEVYGSPSNPLVLTYYAAEIHGSGINFDGTNLSGKITYNTNGGNGNNFDQIVSLGYNNTIKDNPFTRTGYEFKNWNTRADGLGTTYLPRGTYRINSSLTLYAQWNKLCEIQYELNGGRFETKQPQYILDNTSFTVSNPTREGFEFQGWTITGMDSNTHYYGNTSGMVTTNDTKLPYTTVTPEINTFKNLSLTKTNPVLFTAIWKDVSDPELKVSYLNISDENDTDRDGVNQDGLNSVENGQEYIPETWTPHSVKVTAIGSDKGSGVAAMRWEDGEYTETEKLERTYPLNGEYSGAAYAKDKADRSNTQVGSAWIANDNFNEISVPYGTIKIDKIAPTALIKEEGYNEDGYANDVVTIRVVDLKDNEGGSGLPADIYSWDHGITWTSVSYKEYTKSKNDYVLIRDNVGNCRKLEYEVSNIDPNLPGVDPDPDNPTPPPNFPVPSEPWVKIGKVEYPWINHDVKLTFTIKDTTPEENKDDFTTSGVKSVRIYRSDKDFEEEGADIASVSNSVPGVESTKISFTCSVQGITYWVLEAKDYAGNITEIQITVRVDKTNPTVICNPQQFDLNAYGIDEVEDVIKDDNEVYCTFNIFGKDYNDASRGEYVASGDSSGIKQVVLRIMDADDHSSYKDYDLGYKVSTAKECDNTDKGLLEAEFGLKINTFADFPEAVYLTYEIKIVDNADNEAYYACMDGNEIPNFSVKAVMYSNEDTEFNDKTIVEAIDKRTGITKNIETSIPYMQLGDFGYVKVWTIGYVQSIRMDYSSTSFAEDMGDEMVDEIKKGKIPSKYNLGILSDTNYQRDVLISKADRILTSYPDVGGVPYAAKYGVKESDPDINGYKWLEAGTSVRIPLYYKLVADGTKKEDGQDNYFPEIHNGVVYGIKKKNPTSPARLTTSSAFMYIIYDTKANDVHYRITHEG